MVIDFQRKSLKLAIRHYTNNNLDELALLLTKLHELMDVTDYKRSR